MPLEMPEDTVRDYRDTLFLPKTDFAMRGRLPEQEPKWLEFWKTHKLYSLLREDAKRRNAPAYTLHDGPPYANGHLHIGTAMNKILKDIVTRSHQMRGYDCDYIPGWDCHGLPIEWKVEEQFRAQNRHKEDIPAKEFRAACRAYAQKWIDIQKDEFQRLGIEGNWDDPYLTMHFDSEAVIVQEFLRLVMTGLVFRGSKPVMWSPVERTALAEAEVEYHAHESTQIWVRFPVQNADINADLVIWTTTPWTIPANRAIAYNSDISYGLYQVQQMEEDLPFEPWAKVGDHFIMADALMENVLSAAKIAKAERLSDIDPSKLVCAHPLKTMEGAEGYFDFDVPLITGSHVTDEAGTGFVHTAPSHGVEDYEAWLGAGFAQGDIPFTVDEEGRYSDTLPARFRGKEIIRLTGKKRGKAGEANKAVLDALMETGYLLARAILKHQYPHSWRSRAPLIYRNTPQWFIAMDAPGPGGKSVRELALEGISNTQFTPPQSRNRIDAFVEGRPDWLISRQRNWGVPLTLFVNQAGEVLKDEAVNARIIAAVREGGADAWYALSSEYFLGDDYEAEDWTKVEDILDVWFDSGVTHVFTLEARGFGSANSLTPPADIYLEGSDQHRGWFQSSLLHSCATRGRPPFKEVLTHGFTVDQHGKKMSKSLGNTMEPEEIARQYGVEILRIWVAASEFTDEMPISDEIIKGHAETYRKLRNTIRYMLGGLDGFEAGRSVIAYDDLPDLEKWVLHRLQELDGLVRVAYGAHDFKKVMHNLIHFCGVELSSIYFDIRKDALYCDPLDSPRRLACRQVMYETLSRLNCWLAPIMPFTMEEAWQLLRNEADPLSVHLRQFPETPESWYNSAIADKWAQIFKVRQVVTGALEVERREKRIGSSLEGNPVIYLSDTTLGDAFAGEDLAEIFITSDASFSQQSAPDGAFKLDDRPDIAVFVQKAEGIKCARSWKYFDPSTAHPDYPDITPRDAEAVRYQDAQ